MSPRRDNPKTRAIQDLTAGHKSALLLRQRLLEADSTPTIDNAREQQVINAQLLEKIILSFQNSITALDSGDNQSEEMSAKMEDSGESCKPSSTLSVRKGRRGCYKRRKGSESWTKEVPGLVEDGQTWRKYGQKVILNASFPRSYFRCTHKKDQGCLATKQVQQTQSNPPMYTVNYDGRHTCTDSQKQASLFAASGPESSTVFLSFDSADQSSHYQNCCPIPLFGSSDYILSPEFTPFEGMESNSSSNCSGLDQRIEFEVGPVEMCIADFDDLMKLEFEF